MNKTASQEENVYYELDSVKKETEADIYDDVAGDSAAIATQQTSFEKCVQGAEEKRQASTQHEYASRCNTVVLRRMLFVIAAVAAVALLTAIATLILALTAMKPRNDSTEKVQGKTKKIPSFSEEEHLYFVYLHKRPYPEVRKYRNSFSNITCLLVAWNFSQ